MVQLDSVENGQIHVIPPPYSGDYEGVLKNGDQSDLDDLDALTDTSPDDSRPRTPICQQEFKPLIEKINKLIENKDPFFSLEFFPPKTANGVANFLAR